MIQSYEKINDFQIIKSVLLISIIIVVIIINLIVGNLIVLLISSYNTSEISSLKTSLTKHH